MGQVIGIDLGTTYSCVCVFNQKKGKYETIPSSDSEPTVPSVVALNSAGEPIVGRDAQARAGADPQNVVTQIKRHMGPELGPDGNPLTDAAGLPVHYSVMFGGKPHTPEMISSYILRWLKTLAERYLQEPVEAAVITVPAYFKGGPRKATEEAGRLAGLEVKCLISEPTAAAIAFARDQARGEDAPFQRILVYDLGGGTFDVSVIEMTGADSIEVKGVGGDPKLGGVDFDDRLAAWFYEHVKETQDVDLEALIEEASRPKPSMSAEDVEVLREARWRIIREAERVKRVLSDQQSASFNLPILFRHPKTGKAVTIIAEVTRAQLVTRIGKLLNRTISIVETTLAELGLAKTDIHEVILVGGSTKIPKVRELVEKFFGFKPRADVNPDECVALGAAIYGLRYASTDSMSKEEQQRVTEEIERMGEVIDVTGHTLGEEVKGDRIAVMIPKNTPIPYEKSEDFWAVVDYQEQALIRVRQGESQVASENSLLTEFTLKLRPLKKEDQKIRVTYTLNASGVLNVEARRIDGESVAKEVRYDGSTHMRPQDLLPPANGKGKANGAGNTKGSHIPPEMQQTWSEAEKLRDRVDGERRERLDTAMKKYDEAARARDQPRMTAAEDALMNVLYELQG